MKTVCAALFLALCCPAIAQSTAPFKATDSQPQLPAGIETTLKKYISAYERRSMPDLVAIWPDLQNQKKEFGKIKKHFDDGKITNEHMSLHPLQTQTLKDDAIVQCERTERYAKAETVETGGDLGMGRYPTQNPGPHEATKPVNKADKVWMKLHKQGDDWVIVSISDKPTSF